MASVETVLQGYSVRTDEGSVAFCGVYLIRDGDRNLLVDVGHVGRRALLLERMAARGLRPEEISAVILTHAHWDHILNIDLFPHARVLLTEAENDYVRTPHPADWATPAWTDAVLSRHRIEETRDGDEIGTGIRVLATPGHSPGSQTVLVETENGTLGLTGDAMPVATSLADGLPSLVFWSESEARQSIARIAASCRTVYPGHDRPFRIEDGATTYIEQTRITLGALPLADDGTPAYELSTEARRPAVMPSARGR